MRGNPFVTHSLLRNKKGLLLFASHNSKRDYHSNANSISLLISLMPLHHHQALITDYKVKGARN